MPRINLVNDGSFENGTLSVTSTIGTVTYPSAGYSWGARRAQVAVTDTSKSGGVTLNCPAPAGNFGTISYDVAESATTAGPISAYTYVNWIDAGGEIVGVSTVANNLGVGPNASRVVARFNRPDVAASAVKLTMHLAHRTRAVDDWFAVDNIMVEDGDTPGSWPYVMDTIDGGNCDTTVPTYSVGITASIVPPGEAGGGHGDGVMKLEATEAGLSYAQTPRVYPIAPGQRVTVAFDIKYPKMLNANPDYIRVNFFDGASSSQAVHTTSTDGVIEVLPLQDGGSWHRVCYVFTAPEGVAQFRPVIANANRAVGDAFYLDRISVEVGEPDSIPPGEVFPYPDITTGDYCLINDERTGDLWFTLSPGSVRLGGPKIVIQNDNGYSTLEWDIVVNTGESLVVDCQEKTAKINGVNYPPIVREWPVLATGENWFSLRAAEVSTGATMDITYHLGS